MSEISVSSKGEVQKNWEQNAPINDALRNILEPVVDAATEEVVRIMEDKTPEEREALLEETCNLYTLPYGAITALPPALFGRISEESIELTRELVVPETNAAIEEMVEDYVSRVHATGKSSKYYCYATPDPEYLVEKIGDLAGQEYPADKWRHSARVMQDVLKQEPMVLIEHHYMNRLRNSGHEHEDLNYATQLCHRKLDDYVVGMSKELAKDHRSESTRDIVQLPIGEYGKEAAGKMVRSAVLLNDIIKSSDLIDWAVRTKMPDNAPDLLREHTARSRARYELGVQDYAIHGVKNSLTEGLVTVAQTLAMLTAEKVPGYEEHDELVRAILDTDIIERFTRLVPAGYIGPTTLSGVTFKGPLSVKDGKPVLSEGLIGVLSEMHRDYMQEMAAKWAIYRASGKKEDKPMQLGVVCPAAAPKGQLTTSKEMFKAIYAH